MFRSALIKSLIAAATSHAMAALPSLALAASLNVSPIKLETFAPQQTATLSLRNMGEKSITGQVRVFAWRQENGEDVLEPTNEVVGSPPIAEIRPGTDYTIRVVRVAAAPVEAEESYRLVVDEVPDAAARRNGVITVAIRYVIPMFFVSPEASQPRLSWSIAHKQGKTFLSARNEGDRRVQLRDLSLGGRPIAKGLAGYVLGHSERRWELRNSIAGRNITAVSDNGPINGAANGP
jgi:fimbrial chaperone protein